MNREKNYMNEVHCGLINHRLVNRVAECICITQVGMSTSEVYSHNMLSLVSIHTAYPRIKLTDCD